MSEMPLLKPLISAPITITTVTPIATPRSVSAARILCARSEDRAMPTPSNSRVTGLLLPQRGARTEPGGTARRVNAEQDSHASAPDHTDAAGLRRHPGGQRR